ncbi:MAG TPA: helix-turn-helix domain-containing protein [Streptosporangiaceae bacterium]|nr:helix-turn-helix domain-containing protein [Streptosporangiaceae bacterium]
MSSRTAICATGGGRPAGGGGAAVAARLPSAQIAALLDCHPATVRRWISRFNDEGHRHRVGFRSRRRSDSARSSQVPTLLAALNKGGLAAAARRVSRHPDQRRRGRRLVPGAMPLITSGILQIDGIGCEVCFHRDRYQRQNTVHA